MVIKALACDFDGTLASSERIGSYVRQTLERARAADLRLILVTGCTFFELTRAWDFLELFDGVVAENGAVVYYPRLAMIRDQGPPAPGRLLAELDERGIGYRAGRVIVGAARAQENGVREALVAAGVTRELVYDRGALVLLPSGVSKGSGVHHVLRFLGLSPHDVLAIGVAASDFALFDACGFGACSGDSVEAVRERADWIFPETHADGVATAIANLVFANPLPVRRSRRQRIALGWAAATNEPVTIPARGINVLIHGDSHSGKSWLAGALVERLMAARYAVCVIDPEGDYRVLSPLPGMAWAEIVEPADVDRIIGRFGEDPTGSVVLDLSTVPHAAKVAVVDRALRAIRDMRRQWGRPHWIVIDEAHYWFDRGGGAPEALGVEDRGFCLVTYRSSRLRDEVVATVDVFLIARTALAAEQAFLRDALPVTGEGTDVVTDVIARLPRREFVMVQRDSDGRGAVVTFVAAPRQTVHVRHLAKYVDSLVAPGREFLFRRPGGQVTGAAASLQSFRRAVATAPDEVLAHHAGHGDFSRWVQDVFGDAELARQLGKAEARWRRNESPDLRGVVDELISVRYGGED